MRIRNFFLALGVILSACQAESLPPAPLGEHAALEKLAGAYETLGEHLPVSPASLTPEGKLKFVREVFAQAGYDYNATLRQMAGTAPQDVTTYHKDMMELVLLPGRGLNAQDREALFDEPQRSEIAKIHALQDQ